MRPGVLPIFAAAMFTSLSSAQLPGQVYIVTINGTITTVIEPLDAPGATFTGTDSLGIPTTVETTEPVTASTTPVAVSLTQLIGDSSPTTTGSTQSDTRTAASLSGAAIGSPTKPSAALALLSPSRIVIGMGIPFSLIILAIKT